MTVNQLAARYFAKWNTASIALLVGAVALVSGSLPAAANGGASSGTHIGSAVVTRVSTSPEGVVLRIDWTTSPGRRSHSTPVYEGSAPDETDTLLATVTGSSYTTPPLPTTRRHYFRLGDSGRRGHLVAERVLVDLTGIGNIRDIGGYDTSRGEIGWGRVYRSGNVGSDFTDPAQRAYLDGLGIRTVVDLRSPEEVVDEGRYLPAGARLAELPIAQEDPVRPLLCNGPAGATNAPFGESCFQRQVEEFGPSGEHILQFLMENTKLAVWDPDANPTAPDYDMRVQVRDAWAQLLLILADPANYPVLIEDSGGSGRAGFAAALVERIAGVSEPDMVADFLLSNTVRGAASRMTLDFMVSSGWLRDSAMLEPLFFQPPEVIGTATAEVSRLYDGSWREFARDGLGLRPSAISRIRANLTSPGRH